MYKWERRQNLIVEGKVLKVNLQEVVALKSGRTICGSQWYILNCWRYLYSYLFYCFFEDIFFTVYISISYSLLDRAWKELWVLLGKKKKGKKLMGFKAWDWGKMLFRRAVPDSDMNCTTDIWQICLCQFKTYKAEVIPSIMQKKK